MPSWLTDPVSPKRPIKYDPIHVRVYRSDVRTDGLYPINNRGNRELFPDNVFVKNNIKADVGFVIDCTLEFHRNFPVGFTLLKSFIINENPVQYVPNILHYGGLIAHQVVYHAYHRRHDVYDTRFHLEFTPDVAIGEFFFVSYSFRYIPYRIFKGMG